MQWSATTTLDKYKDLLCSDFSLVCFAQWILKALCPPRVFFSFSDLIYSFEGYITLAIRLAVDAFNHAALDKVQALLQCPQLLIATGH
jgi:hypothetical protein